jgi:hypothetical protein
VRSWAASSCRRASRAGIAREAEIDLARAPEDLGEIGLEEAIGRLDLGMAGEIGRQLGAQLGPDTGEGMSSGPDPRIERWHQTMKNRILLENYYLPGDLEARIDAFVAYYNHRRYHESLNNLTPADVYFGRGQTILLERERIKRRTIELRRLLHAKAAA